MGGVGYALRTLVGPWLTLVAIVLYLRALLERGAPWRGETMWTLEWLGIAMFALGPLVAGACAIDAARIARPQAAYLVVPTKRPRMTFVRAALWTALPLVVWHIAVYLVAVIGGGSPFGQVFRPDLIVGLAVQCAVILWYAAIGSLIGRFSPPILSGIIAAVVALLGFFLLSNSASGTQSFGLLDIGGATVTQIGQRYVIGALLLQLLVLVGTAIAVAFVRVRYRAGRVLPTRAGVVVILGIFAVLVLAQLLGPDQRKALTSPEAPDRCYGDSPTICLYEYHARHADEVAERVRQLVDAARSHGYQAFVPERIEQEAYNYVPTDPKVRSFFLDPGDMDNPGWEQEAVIQGMLIPRCPALESEQGPGEKYFEDLTKLMGTWAVIADVPDVTGLYETPEDALTPLEVEKILDRWSRCDLS